ncbi:MAG: MATE family efflux transporter [Clostridia bacterium]|nr:MATE family efflux transporter [Clostridia bacterium]
MEALLTPKPELPRKRQIFTNGALRAMIVPLLIEQLLQLVVGIADTMMVSYAGEATVSGVSLDTMIYTIFIYLFTAAATGCAVVVSQYIGRGDGENANLAASQGFHIAGILSIGCMALTLLFGNALLRALYFGVEPEVMSACRIYLRIVALSFPANAIYNAGAALYRSMGKTRTTMVVSVAMNLINVIGNAIGVFVLRAGAAGVAWPTTISWYFAAVCMVALCLNDKLQVYIRVSQALRLHREMALRILRIAVPNATEGVLFQLAKVVLGSLIATFGTSQIAANGIGQTLWSLGACMSSSMGPVFITVIGQCMGANDTQAAAWYMRKLTRLTLLLSAVWNAALLLLVPLILPLYSITAETRHYIWVIVIIHNVFAGLVQPFAMPLSSGLRAAGDVQFSMWSSIVCTVVFRTLLSFALGLWLHMGIVGIAWAMVLDWCLKAVLDVIRFRGGQWMNKRVI